MVVDMPTTAVTRARDVAERAGQLGTSGAQLQTVNWVVWYTVEVETAGTYSTTRTLVVTGSPMFWPKTTAGIIRAMAAAKTVESCIVAMVSWW
jgi:hypothetical protein